MDTRSARLDLAHDASAPRLARRFLSTLMSGWGVAVEAIEQTQLLVSELVSNAVLHGHGPICLMVTETDADEGVYRIEVHNVGSGTPTMRHPDASDLSGRGLQLVDQISRGWGSRTVNGETRVWFELRSPVAS